MQPTVLPLSQVAANAPKTLETLTHLELNNPKDPGPFVGMQLALKACMRLHHGFSPMASAYAAFVQAPKALGIAALRLKEGQRMIVVDAGGQGTDIVLARKQDDQIETKTLGSNLPNLNSLTNLDFDDKFREVQSAHWGAILDAQMECNIHPALGGDSLNTELVHTGPVRDKWLVANREEKCHLEKLLRGLGWHTTRLHNGQGFITPEEELKLEEAAIHEVCRADSRLHLQLAGIFSMGTSSTQIALGKHTLFLPFGTKMRPCDPEVHIREFIDEHGPKLRERNQLFVFNSGFSSKCEGQVRETLVKPVSFWQKWFPSWM